MQATESTTRRTFLIGTIYGMWALITAALGVPSLVYLLLPPKIHKENEWTEIGDIGKLAVDSPVEMIFRRNRIDGWRVINEKSTAWVVRHSADSIVAFGPQCTHLGCAYHWEDSKHQFLCPCHTSLFSLDGKVMGGPATRPLDRYQTKVDGNKLLVGSLERAPEEAE